MCHSFWHAAYYICQIFKYHSPSSVITHCSIFSGSSFWNTRTRSFMKYLIPVYLLITHSWGFPLRINVILHGILQTFVPVYWSLHFLATCNLTLTRFKVKVFVAKYDLCLCNSWRHVHFCYKFTDHVLIPAASCRHGCSAIILFVALQNHLISLLVCTVSSVRHIALCRVFLILVRESCHVVCTRYCHYIPLIDHYTLYRDLFLCLLHCQLLF